MNTIKSYTPYTTLPKNRPHFKGKPEELAQKFASQFIKQPGLIPQSFTKEVLANNLPVKALRDAIIRVLVHKCHLPKAKLPQNKAVFPLGSDWIKTRPPSPEPGFPGLSQQTHSVADPSRAISVNPDAMVLSSSEGEGPHRRTGERRPSDASSEWTEVTDGELSDSKFETITRPRIQGRKLRLYGQDHHKNAVKAMEASRKVDFKPGNGDIEEAKPETAAFNADHEFLKLYEERGGDINRSGKWGGHIVAWLAEAATRYPGLPELWPSATDVKRTVELVEEWDKAGKLTLPKVGQGKDDLLTSTALEETAKIYPVIERLLPRVWKLEGRTDLTPEQQEIAKKYPLEQGGPKGSTKKGKEKELSKAPQTDIVSSDINPSKARRSVGGRSRGWRVANVPENEDLSGSEFQAPTDDEKSTTSSGAGDTAQPLKRRKAAVSEQPVFIVPTRPRRERVASTASSQPSIAFPGSRKRTRQGGAASNASTTASLTGGVGDLSLLSPTALRHQRQPSGGPVASDLSLRSALSAGAFHRRQQAASVISVSSESSGSSISTLGITEIDRQVLEGAIAENTHNLTARNLAKLQDAINQNRSIAKTTHRSMRGLSRPKDHPSGLPQDTRTGLRHLSKKLRLHGTNQSQTKHTPFEVDQVKSEHGDPLSQASASGSEDGNFLIIDETSKYVNAGKKGERVPEGYFETRRDSLEIERQRIEQEEGRKATKADMKAYLESPDKDKNIYKNLTLRQLTHGLEKIGMHFYNSSKRQTSSAGFLNKKSELPNVNASQPVSGKMLGRTRRQPKPALPYLPLAPKPSEQ